ncbi:zinc ribbon domain-containing protein [Waterburya agarophytonicola K14]|uniref:Zinc ribbon domain-containing protein n=1 Tax=Waterburya agarophytonicola KI4 TaxID=2874699 RepID=A0A964BRX9_9CYAN|nr:zinc ribbon domain-containing protein [Waterburya agarophytonicola]MCC0176720.1 zinc ribbon domain-containing protein [Waterburya agarophytonicola KI4]
MSYTANLTENRRIAIANRGNQTTISLTSSNVGQQQSQTTGFTTGSWQSLPQLYQLGTNFVLKINSDRNSYYLLIQAHGISTIPAPDLNNAVEVDLQKSEDSTTIPHKIEFEPMAPMPPMQPMKMGNMSMDLNSMSMKMGNMSLNMNDSQTSTSTKHFCSQCGQKAKISDRFCSSCGYQLDR